MNFSEVILALETAGSAQTRKTYARHGVTGPQFGVSYATQAKLKKQIRTDDALARLLWQTGNHDARILCLMVADSQQYTRQDLQQMASLIDNSVLADQFAKFVADSPFAEALALEWRHASSELLRAISWCLIVCLALQRQNLPQAWFQTRLEEIEQGIRTAQNRVRYEMNGALIAIGVRSPELTTVALTVADRLGKVHVDHGDTNCKTPDARTAIEKTLAHQKRSNENA